MCMPTSTDHCDLTNDATDERDCSYYYDCCSCGHNPNDDDPTDGGCGCRYCFDCNACDFCRGFVN